MPITELWLPILLSAVFVFIASALLHMVIPIHKGDYTQMPAEDAVLEAMRNHGIKPGMFMFPHANSFKELETPEMKAKFDAGPVGYMIVRSNGFPNMGGSLLQWFLFCIVVSAAIAWLGGGAMTAEAEGTAVFRFTAVVAFLAYGLTNVTDSIWKSVSWKVTTKFLFDGLVYALVTGATFVWLW